MDTKQAWAPVQRKKEKPESARSATEDRDAMGTAKL